MGQSESVLEESCPNLFNDQEYYSLLLNDFLATKEDATGQDPASDGQFLYGADLSLTQKFLAKKQRMKELKEEKRREVDRKASKGRKIKYVVHEKLLNFMIPEDNLQRLEGKEQILQTLFQKRADSAMTKQQIGGAVRLL